MSHCQSPVPASEFRESAVYWFARYEAGIEKGDFELVLHARSQLKRLGFDVRPYRPRKPRIAR